jgi:hypothetical protein
MKKYLFTLLAGLIGFSSYSQTSILGQDIKQGEKLLEAYFTPMAESFGAGLNNGWYNTAKPHSLGGFDLTFTLNTVIIPNAAESFKIGNEFGGVFTSTETEASSIFGSSDGTPMTYTNSTTSTDVDFNMPGGFKTAALPLPMIQAGIGLIKNTAIDIRYMPMLNVGKSGDKSIKVNLFGVGLKHDILQWIPVVGDAIPMSLSLQGGYTALNTKLKISGQEVSLNTKATTINLVASKRLLMFTGYAGVGYNSSTTSFSADADFELSGNPGIKFEEKVQMDFESKNNLRANVGFRFNITLVTIQADYTFSEYPTATLGLGVSLR